MTASHARSQLRHRPVKNTFIVAETAKSGQRGNASLDPSMGKWVVILHTHVDGAATVRCNEHLLVEVPWRCIHTITADANSDIAGSTSGRTPGARRHQ